MKPRNGLAAKAARPESYRFRVACDQVRLNKHYPAGSQELLTDWTQAEVTWALQAGLIELQTRPETQEE